MKKARRNNEEKQVTVVQTHDGKEIHESEAVLQVKSHSQHIKDPWADQVVLLLEEANRAHEEIVLPRQWIPYVLISVVPFFGGTILLFMSRKKGGIKNLNIRGFAKISGIFNLLLSSICAMCVLLFVLKTGGQGIISDNNLANIFSEQISGSSVETSSITLEINRVEKEEEIEQIQMNNPPDSTGVIPAEAVPSEAAPAEAMPSEAAPAEAMPSEAAPAEAMPSEVAPADLPLLPEEQTAQNNVGVIQNGEIINQTPNNP